MREADRIGALAVRGDVTNPRDLEAVVQRTVEAFGGIDILVWNSGGPPPGPAIGVSVEALEEAVELLFAPAVRLVALCLPHLVQSAGGRILVFTSVAAREPSTHLALSNAVRPGVTGWAKTLSRELGPRGITVNCVAPGRIDTARLAAALSGRPDRGRPAGDSGRSLGHAAGVRRRRVLPRLRPRPLRHRHDRGGRRRPLARPLLAGMARLLSPLRLAAAGVVLLAVVLVVLVTRGSNQYLEVPDEAHPLQGLVQVPGAKPAKGRRRHLLRRRPAPPCFTARVLGAGRPARRVGHHRPHADRRARDLRQGAVPARPRDDEGLAGSRFGRGVAAAGLPRADPTGRRPRRRA